MDSTHSSTGDLDAPVTQWQAGDLQYQGGTASSSSVGIQRLVEEESISAFESPSLHAAPSPLLMSASAAAGAMSPLQPLRRNPNRAAGDSDSNSNVMLLSANDDEHSSSTVVPEYKMNIASGFISVGNDVEDDDDDHVGKDDPQQHRDEEEEEERESQRQLHHRGRVTFVGLEGDEDDDNHGTVEDDHHHASLPAQKAFDPYNLNFDDEEDLSDDDEVDDRAMSAQRWRQSRYDDGTRAAVPNAATTDAALPTSQKQPTAAAAALDARFVIAKPENNVLREREDDDGAEQPAEARTPVIDGRRNAADCWDHQGPSSYAKFANDIRKSRSQLSLMSCNDVHRTFRLHYDDMRNRLLAYQLGTTSSGGGDATDFQQVADGGSTSSTTTSHHDEAQRNSDTATVDGGLRGQQQILRGGGGADAARRERLVNTTNWPLDPADDVLLPQCLVVAPLPQEARAARGAVPQQQLPQQQLTLRQHQRDGIRFMWRALMQGPLLSVPAVGCILAHSMGLGKTGQVVVYLNLMFQYFTRMRQRYFESSGGSDDDVASLSSATPPPKSYRDACPPVTKKKNPRVVVVAPKSVLSAWEVEFRKWGASFVHESSRCEGGGAEFAPIEPVVIDDRMNKQARMEAFSEVVQNGGLLLVGYEALVYLEKDFTLRRAGAAAAAGSSPTTAASSTPQFGFEPFQLGTTFDLVVCDEGHRLKSSNLDIAKSLSHLYALRRLVLTGTPMQNHLLEYWAMSDFAVPKFFDRRTFLKFFVQPIQLGADGNASEAAVALAKKKTFILVQEFANFTQRVDNEPLRAELPPLSEYVVSVPLSLLQYNLYMKFLDIVRKEHGARFNVLQAFSYASKICAHPQLLLDATYSTGFHGGTYNGLADAMRGYSMDSADGLKLSVAVKIVKAAAAAGEKTLVFSMSTKMLDLLETMMNIADREERLAAATAATAVASPAGTSASRRKRSRESEDRDLLAGNGDEGSASHVAHGPPVVGIKHLRIDGSASGADRERRIAEFQNPNSHYNCFLLSTKAGGVGITVTAATRVILLDCSFNPADDRQAIGRAYRYGQTKPVVVYRLVCRNTIEHRIFDQKVGKEWMFETVVNDKNIKRDGLSGAKLRHIFLMKESTPVCFERPSGGRNKADAGGGGRDAVEAMRALLPESVRQATDSILRSDVCLQPVARSLCSVMLYDSYLEADHGERYGAEEAKSYASYRQSGGLQQTDFETPEIRERLDREATSQWNAVASQSVTLTAIIQNLIQERSASSDATRDILKRLGVVHDDRYNTPLPNHRTGDYGATLTAATDMVGRMFAHPELRPVAHPVILLDTESDDDDDDVVEVRQPAVAATTNAVGGATGGGAGPTSVRPLVDATMYAPFATAQPAHNPCPPRASLRAGSSNAPLAASFSPRGGNSKDDAMEID